jgi:hypothetical protein
MTLDISTGEVGSLNDADSIVGQTFIIATTPPRCPAGNVKNGGALLLDEVSSPAVIAGGNIEGDDIIIGTIFPLPTSIFILEWLPAMLNNKAKKRTTTREGIIYLRNVCLLLGLKHSASKGICIKQILKYYFENQKEVLTSVFKDGVNQEKWKKALAITDKETR